MQLPNLEKVDVRGTMLVIIFLLPLVYLNYSMFTIDATPASVALALLTKPKFVNT